MNQVCGVCVCVLYVCIKEVIESQSASDLKAEEKRMKFEAKQRKEERDFQLRMMSMLCGNPASLLVALVCWWQPRWCL